MPLSRGVKFRRFYENRHFPETESNRYLLQRSRYMIEVSTYNTALKNRLTDYASKYPSECRLIDDDENGCLTFEIKKGVLASS